MIKEFKFKLTKKQKDLCESICDPYTQKLPLFFGYTNTNDNGKIGPVFTHYLRLTSEVDSEGFPNSDHLHEFENIFKTFCYRKKITYNRILRSAINFTTHQPDDTEAYIHCDHDFPHKQFLMYLNNFDGGSTFFYDNNEKVIYKSTPMKYNVIMSDGELHSQGYCAPQQYRVALVVTYV